MQRFAVVATLRPGTAEKAAKLIELGPPFDPQDSELERHTVFLAADAAIFVFEGGDAHKLLAAFNGSNGQSVLGAWESLVDSTPRIAHEVYSWVNPSHAGRDERVGRVEGRLRKVLFVTCERSVRHDDPGLEPEDTNEIRVLLRRADPRWAGAARRQGPRAVGDGAPRRASPCGLHDHDRRLPRVHGDGGELPDGLEDEIAEHIERLERATGATFGDPSNPLLVSVRSGAAISMPGMMDSILDLGLNDEADRGLAAATGNARFAHDSYRRLIQMYGEVVEGIDPHRFEDALDELKAERGVQNDVDLSAVRPDGPDRALQEDLRGRGRPSVPESTHTSSCCARCARSSTRGTRRVRGSTGRRTRFPDDLGTAVNVMQMVFGNKGDDCGTGVCFSRDPSTGERGICGEFLVNAQGEDVVAGIRLPRSARRDARAVPGRVRPSSSRPSSGSSGTTATCRTSSSRSSRVGCTSCRPVPPSAPPPRP